MADRDELAAIDEEHLETLESDVESIVQELEEQGWVTYPLDVDRIHVTTADSDLGQGFEIVASTDSIEPVFEQVTESGVEFDGSEVYGIRDGDQRMLVVAVLATEDHVAVVTPLPYGETGAEMLEAAVETGQLRTLLRSPDGRTIVVTHDDPDIFRPSVHEDEE